MPKISNFIVEETLKYVRFISEWGDIRAVLHNAFYDILRILPAV